MFCKTVLSSFGSLRKEVILSDFFPDFGIEMQGPSQRVLHLFKWVENVFHPAQFPFNLYKGFMLPGQAVVANAGLGEGHKSTEVCVWPHISTRKAPVWLRWLKKKSYTALMLKQNTQCNSLCPVESWGWVRAWFNTKSKNIKNYARQEPMPR